MSLNFQTTNSRPSLKLRAAAELELRRRRREREPELVRCRDDRAHFVAAYCQIYNATDRTWIPFALWDEQRTVLAIYANHLHSVVLKARQLGLSWLTICYILHMMLFGGAITALIFSRRDDEAVEMLARLKGVYQRLPAWLRTATVVMDNEHNWYLSNGSRAMALPTTGGRSYTASVVMVDEADFMPDLDMLLNAVKPTIDAGGQIIMVSTVDKSQPNSPFKRIYRGAKRGDTEWRHVFLPWHARPGRDAAWYATQRADILARTGALDDLHQEYPATESEALAPRSLDKRIPAAWIEACYVEMTPLANVAGVPALAGLEVYAAPQTGRLYVIGGDPAEGNPTSDDSALTVLDLLSGEECAALAGKLEPSTFAAAVDAVGRWYNMAAVMVERNNHGHAVLLWLGDNSRLRVLQGPDEKAGWLNNSLGKTLLYNAGAEMFRDGTTVLHSFDSYQQLAAIEGSTLLAPKGDRDDRADSYVLANVGRAAMMQSGNAAVHQSRVAGRGGDSMIRRSTRRAA